MWNNRGISIVETLIYMGLSVIVLYAAFSLTQVSRGISKSASTFVGLSEARRQIQEALKNDTAFTNSMNQNPAVFACLRNETDCTGAGGQYTLYDAQTPPSPVNVATAVGSNDGLDKNGAPCTTFNAGSGDDTCPFRYIIRWQARCPGGGAKCINPTVELTAQLDVKWRTPQVSEKLNPASYDISYLKANQTATQQSACEKMGGIFQADKTCLMRYKGQQCPAGDFLVGFANDGSLVCRRLQGIVCANGQVVLGIRPDGVAICGPGCASAATTSGSVW